MPALFVSGCTGDGAACNGEYTCARGDEREGRPVYRHLTQDATLYYSELLTVGRWHLRLGDGHWAYQSVSGELGGGWSASQGDESATSSGALGVPVVRLLRGAEATGAPAAAGALDMRLWPYHAASGADASIFALLDDDEEEGEGDSLCEDTHDDDDDDALAEEDEEPVAIGSATTRSAAATGGPDGGGGASSGLPPLSTREWAHLCCFLDPRGSDAPEALPPSLREDALAEHPLARRDGSGSRVRSAWDVLGEGRGRRLDAALRRKAIRVEALLADDGATESSLKRDTPAADMAWSPHPSAVAYSSALEAAPSADGTAFALAALAARHRQAAAAQAAGAAPPSAAATPAVLNLAMSLLRTVFETATAPAHPGKVACMQSDPSGLLSGLLGAAAATLASDQLFDLCESCVSPEGIPGSATAPVACLAAAPIEAMQRLIEMPGEGEGEGAHGGGQGGGGSAAAPGDSRVVDSAGVAPAGGRACCTLAVSAALPSRDVVATPTSTELRRLSCLEVLLWLAVRAGSTEAALRAAAAARAAFGRGWLSRSQPVSRPLAQLLRQLPSHPQLALQRGLLLSGVSKPPPPLRTWTTPALLVAEVPPIDGIDSASVEVCRAPGVAESAMAGRHGCGSVHDCFHGDPSRNFHFWVYPRGAPLVTPRWDTHEGPTDFCSNCRLVTIHSNGVAEYVCGGHQPEVLLCLEPLVSGVHYFEISISAPPSLAEVGRVATADTAHAREGGGVGTPAHAAARDGAAAAGGTPSPAGAEPAPPPAPPVLFSELVRELGVVTADAAAAMFASPGADVTTQASLNERIQAGLLGVAPPGVGAAGRPAKWNASCPFSLPGLSDVRWREASSLGLLVDISRSTAHITVDGLPCGSAPLLLSRPLYAYTLLAERPAAAVTFSRLPFGASVALGGGDGAGAAGVPAAGFVACDGGARVEAVELMPGGAAAWLLQSRRQRGQSARFRSAEALDPAGAACGARAGGWWVSWCGWGMGALIFSPRGGGDAGCVWGAQQVSCSGRASGLPRAVRFSGGRARDTHWPRPRHPRASHGPSAASSRRAILHASGVLHVGGREETGVGVGVKTPGRDYGRTILLTMASRAEAPFTSGTSAEGIGAGGG